MTPLCEWLGGMRAHLCAGDKSLPPLDDKSVTGTASPPSHRTRACSVGMSGAPTRRDTGQHGGDVLAVVLAFMDRMLSDPEERMLRRGGVIIHAAPGELGRV